MKLRALSKSVVVCAILALGTKGAAPSSSRAHTTSFSRYANYIWVATRVNGSAPLLFVLDTGASTCVLNRRTADSLGLSVRNQHKETDLGSGEDSSQVGLAANVTLSFAGVDIQKKEIAVISFESLEHAVGHRIDGILGSEVFNRYVVEIDYSNSQIVLHAPHDYRYAGKGQTLPLELKDDRSFVRGTLDFSGAAALNALFVIDTGANGSLSLHSPFVQKRNLLAPGRKSIQHFVHGTAGTAPERIARAERLRLGAVVLQSPDVALSTASRGSTADPSYDGVIGAEVLRRFKVVLNYSKKQIVLEPNSTLSQPFDEDKSGLSLAAVGADLNTVIVEHVLEDSPASVVGLKEGDVIVSINGQRPTDFTLDQMRQMLKSDGREYELEIRRGNERLSVKIKLHQLI